MAITVFGILLTQLALSFREQLGSDIVAQPEYNAPALKAAVDAKVGIQAKPVVPVQTSGPDNVKSYYVLPTDTIQTLAIKFNTPVTVLQKLNGLSSGDTVSVGQKIVYLETPKVTP